jgi:hypothetical protein
MNQASYALLPKRTLLRLSGKDTRAFLQNLVTNDINQLQPRSALYAALLTPQGKFLHDFIIVDWQGSLFLDCLRERAPDLIRRLTMYKLRADVTIEDVGDAYDIIALFGIGNRTLPENDALLVYDDPRRAELGSRMIAAKEADWRSATADMSRSDSDSYDRFRLALGIPEGGTDIVPEKNFLLECNFEELHGVSFAKGCYVGQELTARTKYRANIRKRLFRFVYDGEIAPGDHISAGDREIATVTSFRKPYGLALTRLADWGKLAETPVPLLPHGLELIKPEYVALPENMDQE